MDYRRGTLGPIPTPAQAPLWKSVLAYAAVALLAIAVLAWWLLSGQLNP